MEGVQPQNAAGLPNENIFSQTEIRSGKSKDPSPFNLLGWSFLLEQNERERERGGGGEKSCIVCRSDNSSIELQGQWSTPDLFQKTEILTSTSTNHLPQVHPQKSTKMNKM